MLGSTSTSSYFNARNAHMYIYIYLYPIPI